MPSKASHCSLEWWKFSTGFPFILFITFYHNKNPNFPVFSGFFFGVPHLRLSTFSRFRFALPSPVDKIFCRFFLARIWPFTRFTFVWLIIGNNAIIWIIFFQTIKLSDISPTDTRIHSWLYQSSGWDFKSDATGPELFLKN